jgi:hypothetical protein
MSSTSNRFPFLSIPDPLSFCAFVEVFVVVRRHRRLDERKNTKHAHFDFEVFVQKSSGFSKAPGFFS